MMDRITSNIPAPVARIYPNGHGHFALGSPDGALLRQDEVIEIFLAGTWVSGTIQWNHNGDYFLASDRSICGLYARMQVRVREETTA